MKWKIFSRSVPRTVSNRTPISNRPFLALDGQAAHDLREGDDLLEGEAVDLHAGLQERSQFEGALVKKAQPRAADVDHVDLAGGRLLNLAPLGQPDEVVQLGVDLVQEPRQLVELFLHPLAQVLGVPETLRFDGDLVVRAAPRHDPHRLGLGPLGRNDLVEERQPGLEAQEFAPFPAARSGNQRVRPDLGHHHRPLLAHAIRLPAQEYLALHEIAPPLGQAGRVGPHHDLLGGDLLHTFPEPSGSVALLMR